MMSEQGQIIRRVQALISEKYKEEPIVPLSSYLAVVVEADMGPRKAWTSAGPLINPESSEDQHLEYLHLQDNNTHYFVVKVPCSDALDMVEVETEDEDELQTGMVHKRKAREHNVLMPNSKKVKVEEELQDQSPINLQQQKPRKSLKAKRRISPPQLHGNSEDIDSTDSLDDVFALSPTNSHDNVKPAHCPVLESGPQVELLPDYSPLPLPKETTTSRETFIRNQEIFETTYMEREILGRGTFGDVFEAVRLSDFKLVAIKHIPRGLAANTSVSGQGDSEILEVLLMQMAAGKRGIDSLPNPAIIGFEDVLVLEDEVLIIMENPVNAKSLYDFITSSTRPMLEHEVKSIIKQVLNAAIIMHHNGVLHNDIRTENILVSINDEGPSVKIIDFGCAQLISDTLYDSSIELLQFVEIEYEAQQTTVRQIGHLLSYLVRKNTHAMREELSHEGNDFLSVCLEEEPTYRRLLKNLQHHPWFHGLTSP
ncbi:serine/threonine-protein kinase pim-1-like [Gouania willdenowi]|uniref:serine/threonine-protein kinase pim-1-like n=1 Tax=Gouania willdenowi TaxID=441366 RepID=UPI0010558E36|nr:serine/threonine-protein kinase pim-1-like [Gouania willdenowi]